MLFDIPMILIVLAVGSPLAFWANRRLRAGQAGVLPYRLGYFAAFATLAGAIGALVDVFSGLMAGEVAYWSLLAAVLLLLAARGICLRRRHGWWSLQVFIGLHVAVLLVFGIFADAPVLTVAGLGVLAAAVVLGRYAYRRREELGSRGAAARTQAAESGKAGGAAGAPQADNQARSCSSGVLGLPDTGAA